MIGFPDEWWGEVAKAVDLAEDLPKTATGKIRRNELKEAAFKPNWAR